MEVQQSRALCSAGSVSLRAGKGIGSSAAHPGLPRERGSLVFTEAEGLLGRALSKQLRASPPGELQEQRKPSQTHSGDKEPPKCSPQGHLWPGQSWGDTQRPSPGDSWWARGHLAWTAVTQRGLGSLGDTQGTRSECFPVPVFPAPLSLTGLGSTYSALGQNPQFCCFLPKKEQEEPLAEPLLASNAVAQRDTLSQSRLEHP